MACGDSIAGEGIGGVVCGLSVRNVLNSRAYHAPSSMSSSSAWRAGSGSEEEGVMMNSRDCTRPESSESHWHVGFDLWKARGRMETRWGKMGLLENMGNSSSEDVGVVGM